MATTTKQDDVKRVPDVSGEVRMDGSEMPAMTIPAGHVVFTFKGYEEGLSLWLHDLTPEILAMAALHGLKQKLGDAAAISRNTSTGKSATVADKREAVVEVYERLLRGEWNKANRGGVAGNLLLQALTRMYEGRKTEEQLAGWLAERTDKELADLKKQPRVAAIMNEIRAERTGTGAASGLLDELDNL